MKQSALVILIASFLLGSCGSGGSNQGTQKSAEVPFILSYIDGQVLVDGKPGVLGSSIPQSSTITTGKDSACEITFDQKNILRLKENTIFVLTSLTFPQTVELKSGAMGLVLHKLTKILGADSFKVKTPQTALGVRGTVFYVKADDTQTYHCSCNGHVEISPFAGSPFLLTGTHHAARIIGNDGTLRESTLLDHDDSFLESLAQRIGDQVNWTVQE